MNEENVMTTNEMNREERMPFFRIPKVILTDENYVGLSEDAMLLYGILLDRRSLSERNDWRDKKGDVFVYCTSNNLNQVAKRANETGNIYETDIKELQEEQLEIKELLRGILDELTKMNR